MTIRVVFFLLLLAQTALGINKNLRKYYSRQQSVHDGIKSQFDEGKTAVTTYAWVHLTTVTATSGWDEVDQWTRLSRKTTPATASVTDSPQPTSTQEPAAADLSPTQSPSFAGTSSTSSDASWSWQPFHDDTQSQFDEGKTGVTARATEGDGAVTWTKTMTATSGGENNLMARTIIHDHLHATATNSPQEVGNWDRAGPQVAEVSAKFQSMYDYIQSQFDGGKTVATATTTFGGPGPVFTNTPGWNTIIPYATFAPRPSANASLRPRVLSEDTEVITAVAEWVTYTGTRTATVTNCGKAIFTLPTDGPDKRDNPWAGAASSAWKSFHDGIESQFDEGKSIVTATAMIMEQALTITMTSTEGWDRSFPYHIPSSWPHSPRCLHERAPRKSQPKKDKKNGMVATAVFSGSSEVPDMTGKWLATIYVGTPPQNVSVKIDTTTTDFWVPKSGFNESASSTYVHIDDTFWSDNSMTGSLVHDTLSFGTLKNDAEIEFANTTFGLTIGAQTSDGSYGGLGLGFASLDEDRDTSFLTWLGRTHNITLFTLDLQPGSEGHLEFGSIDSSRFKGKINYTPAKPYEYQSFGESWAINITSFAIGSGKKAKTVATKAQVVLDTNMNYLGLPEGVVEEYYSHVKGASYRGSGQWGYPCTSKLLDLTFRLEGGYVGHVTKEALKGTRLGLYDEEPDDDGSTSNIVDGVDNMCYARLMTTDREDVAFFGLPIFQHHFMVFDVAGERVGFANKA
ncbi:uncharacterized protein PAC_16944 [Phialocephala subalpina]|uniref:Peptidase A1 domain-containing protein n=1 Tax=Phialocephala subalpina TaxID=576137 RepID=A0A1L7XPV4_9HELO|nr:uncharacterized protein PAC_16944 [Phialocephala subalpina]